MDQQATPTAARTAAPRTHASNRFDESRKPEIQRKLGSNIPWSEDKATMDEILERKRLPGEGAQCSKAGRACEQCEQYDGESIVSC